MTRVSRKAFYPAAASQMETARLLAETAYEAYSLSLANAPRNRRVFDAMRNVQAGNLVLEVSSYARSSWPAAALGHLLFVAGRKPRTEEEWEDAVRAGHWKMEAAKDVRSRGPYHYIDPIDGSQRRCWEDADFIRVLDIADFRAVVR